MYDTDAVPQASLCRSAACVALMMVTLVASSVALAQSKPALQLEVKGSERPGEACLQPESLRSRVAHYMARKSPPPRLRVVVDLALLATDTAELRIYRDDALLSRRRFQRLPTTCDDRRDAVALTIALALEDPAVTAVPAATSSAAPEQPAETADSTALTAATSSAAPEQPAETADSTAVTAATSSTETVQPTAADSSSDVGTTEIQGSLPSAVSHSLTREPGVGFQLQAGARWIANALPFPVWAGSVGVALLLDEHISIAISALASTLGETSFATGSARGRLYGLEAVGCGSFKLGPAALELCAGVAAAACDVSGRDYPMARPDTTLLWAAGLARVAVRWPAASTFSLRLYAQGHANISRPTLEVERAATTLKPGWIGLTLGLQLVISLP